MAKMNDLVPKERLGTSRLNHVFLKIYSGHDPQPQNFRNKKFCSELTFMQRKRKIYETDFLMWDQKYNVVQNLSYRFL